MVKKVVQGEFSHASDQCNSYKFIWYIADYKVLKFEYQGGVNVIELLAVLLKVGF